MVSLTLQPVAGTQLTTATLDTGARVSDVAPLTCPLIVTSVQQDPTLTQFNVSQIIETLQTFNSSLTSSVVDRNQNLPQAQAEEITTYLTALRTTDYPKIQHVANCVTEQNAGTSLAPYEQAAEESKARLAAITAPETHVSYYESSFPRPMKEQVIFTLFGTALLLLFISVAFFLGMGGVQFQIIAPNWVLPLPIGEGMGKIALAAVGTGVALGVVGRYLNWF